MNCKQGTIRKRPKAGRPNPKGVGGFPKPATPKRLKGYVAQMKGSGTATKKMGKRKG